MREITLHYGCVASSPLRLAMVSTLTNHKHISLYFLHFSQKMILISLLRLFRSILFLILLVIRLDRSVSWNWFLIFIPLWVLDLSIFLHDLVKLVQSYRESSSGTGLRVFSLAAIPDVRRLYWTLSVLLLKTAFQVLLCLRLEYQLEFLRVPYVLAPLWVLLLGVAADVFWKILQSVR